MKVSELYAKYKDVKPATKEDLYKLLDDNVKFSPLSIDEKIGIIREVNDNCIKTVDGFSYIDLTLQYVGVETAFVSGFTDLEFEDIKDSDIGAFSNFDQIKEMQLKEYLLNRYPFNTSDFEKIVSLETKNFRAITSASAIVGKYADELFNSVGLLVEKLSDAIENFNPDKIDEAKEVLKSMNDSVVELSKLRNKE